MNMLSQIETMQVAKPQCDIGILLLDNFSLTSLTMFMEPLNKAGQMGDGSRYNIDLLGLNDGMTFSDSQIPLPTHFYASSKRKYGRLLVCGGMASRWPDSVRLRCWLQKHVKRGIQMGGIADGTDLLAKHGLLTGGQISVHAHLIDGFREKYPNLTAVASLYSLEGSVFSCAGEGSAFDMALKIVELDFGHELRRLLTDRFLLEGLREGTELQKSALSRRLEKGNPQVLKAVMLMADNLETPLSIARICEAAEVSPRRLQRSFLRLFAMPPSDYYQQLRLRRAKALLEQTDLAVTEIGIACGYVNLSHFGQCFRARHKISPSMYRKMYI